MNRRNYLQTLSALFAVSAFGGCTSAGKQKDASNSETDIAAFLFLSRKMSDNVWSL